MRTISFILKTIFPRTVLCQTGAARDDPPDRKILRGYRVAAGCVWGVATSSI